MKEIPLTNSDKVVLVEDADFDLVNKFSWHLSHYGYAVHFLSRRLGKQRCIRLHVLVMGKKIGFEVDHKDSGNLLDCRRSNLRHATSSQNKANTRKRANTTSKYKGVYWNRKRAVWHARITVHGKTTYLGAFVEEKEAAEAYDRAAIKYFGEFAKLNFG